MAMFLVFTRSATTDQSEMDVYASKAGATMAGHAVTPLVAASIAALLIAWFWPPLNPWLPSLIYR